mmetsp:Transcript_829/g.1494  ORF Transcript_829/g.1494 Transcript_829/m.1494 type:complete len:83 (-) Transcript_829:144-392(-)
MAYSKLFNVFMKTPEAEEKDSDWVDVDVELTDKDAGGDYVNMADIDQPNGQSVEERKENPLDDSSGDVYVNVEHDDDSPVLA